VIEIKNSYGKVAKIYGKNKSIHETVKKKIYIIVIFFISSYCCYSITVPNL
jgi:hypothetical protein